MITFQFKTKKALNVLLYIINKLNAENIKADIHKIFKILYFADFYHIENYARPIIGDRYIAMEYGPVPSKIYDIIKIIRNEALFSKEKDQFNDFLGLLDSKTLSAKKKYNNDYISESEIECLNKSYSDNKNLSFMQLLEKSHGIAYKKARKDDSISFLEMGKESGSDSSVLKYMKELSENEKILA